MPLLDLWLSSRQELERKHVRQIIAIAGDGQLIDDSQASSEFREFLSHVISDLLREYADQCLQDKFDDQGFALQDIINEVGKRLGFEVWYGRYRGKKGEIGYDGVWSFPSYDERRVEHYFVIEIKTTDAYRINQNRISGYRESLLKQGRIPDNVNSSVLIVVGREDTGDLEAQIRGSQHSMSTRIISIDALMQLMKLREEVENPHLIRQIWNVLVPRDFTKLDGIVELLFSTAEDVKQDEPETIQPHPETDITKTTASFRDACIERLEVCLQHSLVQRSRVTYSSPDSKLALVCLISKVYPQAGIDWFWFGVRPHQLDYLDQAEESYIAFGCGSENLLLLVRPLEFREWTKGLNFTEDEDRFHWHVRIVNETGRLFLPQKEGAQRIEVTNYLLPAS